MYIHFEWLPYHSVCDQFFPMNKRLNGYAYRILSAWLYSAHFIAIEVDVIVTKMMFE